MTPLMASHKEAGAMGLGRDGLNLCEGAGEGTAAPAKTARPPALPPGGQNQRYQGQHNLVRCRRYPPVECALVVYLRYSSFEVHGLLPHRHAKVLPRAIGRGCHCAPETQLTPAANHSSY